MRLDSYSVGKFIDSPGKYLLKVETTRDGEEIIRAEEKGIWTWVKAHLPIRFFGDYSLKKVVSLLGNLDPKQSDLRNSVNSVILKYKLVHPEAKIAILQSPKQSQCLSYEDVLARANNQFANNPLKDAILERIKSRLKEFDYKKMQEEGNPIKLDFHWGDTLWSPAISEDYTEEQKRAIKAATGFLQKLPGIEVIIQK